MSVSTQTPNGNIGGDFGIAGGADEGAVRHLWLSPWTRWVGYRYLKSKKHSRFLSFITILSVLGVGLGVTSMIVVLSVMDGFEAKMKDRLMGTDMHVLIEPTSGVPGFDAGFVPQSSFLSVDQIAQFKKQNPEVVDFWPIVSSEAILKVGRKVAGVIVKGITTERMDRLKSKITEYADDTMLVHHEDGENIRLPEVVVGQELADTIGAIPGDEVTLISPTETEGPMGTIPRMKRYVIGGIYRTGLPQEELNTVYATDSTVRAFLRRADVVSSWELTVKDFDDAPKIAAKLRRLEPAFKIQDWIQLNAHLFASLRLERVAMFIILAFIVIVASFNIVTTLTLMVLEKKREIAIMKAMGARHGQVAAVFLSEGVLIGAVGVIGGVLLAFFMCAVLKRYEFIKLPDIYYDRDLPVTFNLGYYVLVAVSALVIVLAACLYPSHRAAKLDPLEGIRFG